MAEYIPFVHTDKDCRILLSTYSDAATVRLSLETGSKTSPKIPANIRRWVDGGVDGLDKWPAILHAPGPYLAHIQKYAGHDQIGSSVFQAKPDESVVESFASAILDDCRKLNPGWISVPQLPQAHDSSRNKINRALAKAAGRWAIESAFQGSLILPIIFTHQEQVNSKTARNPRVRLAAECFTKARAKGVWVVESSLYDQEGSKTFEHKRFPALVQLHEELKAALPDDAISIAGPYWGMNLVLWARGLATYPAIGIGNSYQYHIPGGRIMAGKDRIAIPPLRRWAIASQHLKHWLRDALRRIPKSDPAYFEFQNLEKEFDTIALDGRTQVARFYRDWFAKIAASPRPGRALTLYQDLSTAYVLGKTLPEMPKDEGTARKSDRVAKQFMLNCL